MANKNRIANISIQKKIVVSMVALFIGMFGALYGVFYNGMAAMLSDSEHTSIDSQIKQAKSVLTYPLSYLPDVTRSWSSDWNLAYEYAIGNYDDFPESYLNGYPFRLYDLDFITVLDANSEVLIEQSSQQEDGSGSPLPEGFDLTQIYDTIGSLTLERYETEGPEADAAATGVYGFIKIDSEIYYLSSQPITRLDKTGGCVGSLVFGRIVTDDFQYLNFDPRVSITIQNAPELLLPVEQMQEFESTGTLIRTNDQGEIEAYTQIQDVFGGNGLALSITSPRYLYNDGLLFISLNLLGIALFCAAMLFIVLMLLKRIIVRPLNSLADEANSIDLNSSNTQFSTTYKSREFNVLAHAASNMLERIKANRDEIEANNKVLYYHANFDRLTGLKNRRSLEAALIDALEAASRSNTKVVVFLLNLDRFKFINDTLGHHTGDAYLVAIAKRVDKELSMKLKPIVGRFGGDSFAVIFTDIHQKNDLHKYAAGIRELFETPFIVNDRAMRISASVGSSVYPDDGVDAETLLRNSDIAMNRAKELGRNTHCQYESAQNTALQRKLYVENRIRCVIDDDCSEFEAFYQPKVLSKNKKITSCEALVRWITPEGIICPDEFIPLAEETGLIVPLSKWMLEEASRYSKMLEAEGIDNIVSVNISAQVLLHKDFFNMLIEAAKNSGADISKLDIEITEATLVEDFLKVEEALKRLRDLGATVSIDDFGTGYSSLSYIKRLPIDRIKIDQSFIADLNNNEDDKSIVNAIVAMAKSLHLLVTAEGVEDAEQFAYLKSLECEEIQGYHVSRPMASKEYIAFYKSWMLCIGDEDATST